MSAALRTTFAALALFLCSAPARAQTSPPSRPILFVHGWCGSVYDWANLYSALFNGLPQSLYPTPATSPHQPVYYVQFNSRTGVIRFALENDPSKGKSGGLTPLTESAIPSSARLFAIQFYDPILGSDDPADVTRVSILNKAYELAQVIKHITSITGVGKVNIVAHSMGGLDVRAYLENMASAGDCYDYVNNLPYYKPPCAPGQGGASYANDVGAVITIDTPHAGSPLADSGLRSQLPNSYSCQKNDSVNSIEISPSSKLLNSLNYGGQPLASKLPDPLTVRIQAVANEFSDVTYSWTQLNGLSDDVVQSSSQCLTDDPNASECTIIPTSKSLTSIFNVNLSHHLATPSLDQDVKNDPECWIIPDTEPMLHSMSCLGHLVSVEYEIPFLLINDTVPWISSWAVAPTTLNLGGSVSISYTATDLSSSTLSRAELWRAPDANGRPGVWTEVDSPQTLSGHGPSQVKFIDTPKASGTYWYGTHLFDSAGNEANEAIPGKVTIPGPDLAETSTTSPPSAMLAGSSFPVTDAVKNIGNLASGSSITRYYLSTTASKTSSSILLTGTRSVPALGVNAVSSGLVAVTIPTTAKPGTYYLLACADDTHLVPESNETNNCIASSGKIVLTLVGGGGIQLGQTVAGALSSSAPAGHCRSGVPADRWQFTLTASTTVTIEADSTAFDTYLCLLNSTNGYMITDDNSGPGTNARIIYQNLPVGTYYVEVSSTSSGYAGGAYTLSLKSGLPPGKAISVGQTLSSTLTTGQAKGACRTGVPADRWQFTLTASTTVTIEADSTAFDTYLCLLNSTNGYMIADNNSAGGTNAKIAITLPASSTYYVEVSSMSSGYAGGTFSLSVK